MAWSLGTVAGFGSTRAQLTVTLANPIPSQVDNGARAFGTLHAKAVSANASPATLRTDVSTPG